MKFTLTYSRGGGGTCTPSFTGISAIIEFIRYICKDLDIGDGITFSIKRTK